VTESHHVMLVLGASYVVWLLAEHRPYL